MQRQIGVGWAQLRELPPPAAAPSLSVAEVDAAFAAIGALGGAGSVAARRAALAALFGRADAEEQQFLVRLLLGDLGQGALAGVMSRRGGARRPACPLADVRRALMLGGDLRDVAEIALAEGRDGLRAVRLAVGRPLAPMLAGSASDLGAALGRAAPAAVEWKLDGVRVQVHRDGDDVAVFTRTLDDMTAPRARGGRRSPGRFPHARSCSTARRSCCAPTAGRRRSRTPPRGSARATSSAGRGRARLLRLRRAAPRRRDLVDAPLRERAAALDALVPAEHRVPRAVAGEREAADAASPPRWRPATRA